MRIVALALTLVLLAACGGGDEVVTSDGPRPSEPVGDRPAGEQRYTVTTTVLESPQHGPQLCLAGTLDSYPPQCGGPDVVGWDWEEVPAKESASGTTWGDYTVVGTWDGEVFTLTEPPAEPTRVDPPADDDRFATPCPEPEGGWQVVDPATATDAAMQAAIEYAEAQPDVGGVWLDQSINPASPREQPDEGAMNDPGRLVLNVTFTGDLERHEAELRDRWGGPLCVSRAAASMPALERIRAEVEEELAGRYLHSSIDVVRGRVEIGVIADDGSLQQRFDERHGDGVVAVSPMLQPVEG